MNKEETLHNMIANAPSGSTIQLGEGVWEIAEKAPTIIKDRITLVGAGKHRTFIKCKEGAKPATSFGASALIQVGTPGNPAHEFTLSQLTLDGSSASLDSDSDHQAGVMLIEGHSPTFLHLYITNTGRCGITNTQSVVAHEDVTIDHCTINDSGQHGVYLHWVQGLVISQCSISRSGSHCVVLNAEDAGKAPAHKRCEDVLIADSFMTKAEPPTKLYAPLGGKETGKFIQPGQGTDVWRVLNCVLFDNRNAKSDGIGSEVSPANHPNFPTRGLIQGNTVIYAGAFGIDALHDVMVESNTIVRPGTHGIALAYDLGGSARNVSIVDNLIVEPDEQETGIVAAIAAVSLIPGRVEGVSLIENTLKEHRGRTRYGVYLDTDLLNISHIHLAHNRMEKATHPLFIRGDNISHLTIGKK